MDGEDTGFKAQGPKGDNGVPLQPRLSEDGTKIEYSLDGEEWKELFPLSLITPNISFEEPVGLEPGATPTVENVGDGFNVNLQFGLPKAPEVNVGATTTIGEGNQAKVTNSGTPYAPVLNFQIPKGDTGRGITIKGFYPDLSTLQEKITSPAIGDVYCVGSAEPYTGYVWTNVYNSESQTATPAWQSIGSINKDTTILVNELGDREDVGVTQKGVTENINYILYEDIGISNAYSGFAINYTNGNLIGNISESYAISIDVRKYSEVHLVGTDYTTENAGYALIKDGVYVSGNKISSSEDFVIQTNGADTLRVCWNTLESITQKIYGKLNHQYTLIEDSSKYLKEEYLDTSNYISGRGVNSITGELVSGLSESKVLEIDTTNYRLIRYRSTLYSSENIGYALLKNGEYLSGNSTINTLLDINVEDADSIRICWNNNQMPNDDDLHLNAVYKRSIDIINNIQEIDEEQDVSLDSHEYRLNNISKIVLGYNILEIDSNEYNVVVGGYSTSDGSDTSSNLRLRTNKISFDGTLNVVLNNLEEGYLYLIYCWDLDGSFIGVYNFAENEFQKLSAYTSDFSSSSTVDIQIDNKNISVLLMKNVAGSATSVTIDDWNLSGIKFGYKTNINSSNSEITNEFRDLNNRFKDKTILFLGQSIVAYGGGTLSFPGIVCSMLGAKCINKAQPGSCLRKAYTNGDDFVMTSSDEGSGPTSASDLQKRSLTATVAEKEDKWGTSDFNSYSYENILLPYLDGTEDFPDYIVIDFPSDNNYRGTTAALEYSSDPYLSTVPNDEMKTSSQYGDGNKLQSDPFSETSDMDSTNSKNGYGFGVECNRNTYIGAINFIIKLIYSYNPYAKIVLGRFISESRRPDMYEAQKVVADYWQLPMYDCSPFLGWSMKIIPNSANAFNNRYKLTPESTYYKTDNITAYNMHCLDGIHPYSPGLTEEKNNFINGNPRGNYEIAELVANFFIKNVY